MVLVTPLLPLLVLLLLLLLLQVAGVNFEEMVEAAMGEQLDLSKPLLDYESGNDAITVWLE
jgi:NADH:ubiquinone oxidoreductase subunit 3 (subunit A)